MNRLSKCHVGEFMTIYKKARQNKQTEFIINGFPLKMSSLRYQTFKRRGIACKHCGLKIKFFAIEQSITERPHANAYGINKKGEEILMTKDHIIPKSKGGRNNLSNFQTLCIRCNSKKGNKTS